MAEFEQLGGGGHSPRSNKPNKKLLVYGGLAVGALVLVQSIFRRPTATTEQQAVTPDTGSPFNSADVQAQLQNSTGLLQGYVDQSLTAFYNDISNTYKDQLKDQNDKLSAMQQTIDQLKPGGTTPTPPSNTPLQFKGGFEYRLKPGENLETLANRFYKGGYAGVNKQAILQANQGKTISTGKVVYIPYL
jgi:hypothetical protein